MSERKFYRTVFQLEVLSEDPYPTDIEWDSVVYDITEGDCSGKLTCTMSEEVDGKKMAQLLEAQDSSPYFFNLTEDGEDI